MTTATATTPRLYVGTYHKYNCGSIAGAWLDLDDYTDADEFYEACAELHADEHDPEFMFQDFEGFPESMYGESYLHPLLFEFAKLDDDDRQMIFAYCDAFGEVPDDLATVADRYCGRADNFEDWVYELADDTGLLNNVPEHIARYFDWRAYANSLSYDYTTTDHDGACYIFSNR